MALPLGLILLWSASNTRTNASASIEITAENPTTFRNTVITEMREFGAVRVGEETSYTGSGSSVLTFRITTDRLEEALISLGGLGGSVVGQTVDIADLSEEAGSLDRSLAGVQRCLNSVGGAIDVATDAGEQLQRCRESLEAATGSFESAISQHESDLEVRVLPATNRNPMVLATIFILLATAAGLGVLVWRTARTRTEVDLRTGSVFELDDEGYLRRN